MRRILATVKFDTLTGEATSMQWSHDFAAENATTRMDLALDVVDLANAEYERVVAEWEKEMVRIKDNKGVRPQA